jgi:predicted Zn finger-like uncharacterized protein
MTEVAERVAVSCPSCSPEFETVHEVLTTGGGEATVKCTECGHVHKEQIPSEDAVNVQVVVSQDGESFTDRADVPAGETLRKGEEFVLDTEEAIMEVRITDLQVGDERRTAVAEADEVETIWTRAVDNVSVNVTLNPKDGGREDTRGLTVYVPGDYEFAVGETESFGEEEFSVKALHVRDDALSGYEFEKLDHRGDVALAKDLKRVYADDESSSAWSAW